MLSIVPAWCPNQASSSGLVTWSLPLHDPSCEIPPGHVNQSLSHSDFPIDAFLILFVLIEASHIYIYTRMYVYTHNLHLISSTNKPHLALHVADVFQAQLGANSIDIPNLHSKRTTCWFQNPNRHLLYITRRATCNIYRPIPNPEITPPFHRVSFRHATGSTVSSAWITSSSSKALMTWQIPSCKAFKPRLNDKSFLQNQRQRPAVFKIQNKSRRTSAESSLQLGFHWLNMRKESIAQSFASARHGALARKALVP